jgi:hypothetical protein
VPENVNALVTPGLTRDPITLPAVERVIAATRCIWIIRIPTTPTQDLPPLQADQEITLWIGDLVGAISQVGASKADDLHELE